MDLKGIKSQQNLLQTQQQNFMQTTHSKFGASHSNGFRQLQKAQQNEKLSKRILRSQVINLLDDNLKTRCHKMFQVHETQKNIENLYKIQKKKEFQIKVQSKEQIKMRFGKYKPEIYEPTNKEYLQQNQINKIPFDDVIEDPSRVKLETHKAINKLGKKLSSKQLLEIGEDPGYFIVKPNHKQRKELLNTDTWDELGSVGQIKVDKELKSMQNTMYSGLSKTSQSTSRFMQPIQRIQTPKYNNDDEIHKKNNYIKLKSEFLKQENQIRRENFLKRQQIEQEMKQKRLQDLQTKSHSKMIQAQKVVDKVQENLKENQQKQQQENAKKFEQTQLNRLILKEENDIQLMNSELRQICLEKQIQQNIDKAIQDKIIRVQALRKYPKNKQNQQYNIYQNNNYAYQDNSMDEMLNI